MFFLECYASFLCCIINTVVHAAGKQDILQFKSLHKSVMYDWQVIRTNVFNEQLAAKKRLKTRLLHLGMQKTETDIGVHRLMLRFINSQ